MLSKIGERHAHLSRIRHLEAMIRISQYYRSPSIANPPRRVYATSTNSSLAPVAALASTASRTDAFLSPNLGVSKSLFGQPPPMTLLPTPLPVDVHSALDSFWYPRSTAQEAQNIIDACLYNCYDVPRAQVVFETIRRNMSDSDVFFDISVYNSFLRAYVDMASEHEVENRAKWVSDAWSLFAQCSADGVEPDANTYASMLLILVRFGQTATLAVPSAVHSLTFSELLSKAIAMNMSMAEIMNRLVVQYDIDTERSIIAKLAQQWAVQEGHHGAVLAELGQYVEQTQEEDPIAAFPPVRPVIKPDPELLGYRPKNRKVEESNESLLQADLFPSTPFNLENMRSSLNGIVAARRTLSEDPGSRQKLLESSAIEAAELRMKHDAEKLEGTSAVTAGVTRKRSIREWMWQWLNTLTPRIEAEVAAIVAEEASRGVRYSQVRGALKPSVAPFLTLLKPKKMALITIMELLRLQGSGGVSEGMKTARAVICVGQAVELEHNVQVRKKLLNRHRQQHKDKLLDRGTLEEAGLGPIQYRREAAREEAKHESSFGPNWIQSIRVRVGSILVDALMDTATITRTGIHPRTGDLYSEEQPAFNHAYEYIRGRKLGVIKLNPEIAKHFAQPGAGTILHPRHLPMLVPPRPWVGHQDGAYIYNKTPVMRIKESQEQLRYLVAASNAGHLEFVYAGLDVLGSTPWVINQETFRVMLEVWNSGEGLAKIPPVSLDLEEPPKPDDYDTNLVSKNRYLADLKNLINARRNNHSDRCHVNYKLEIARAFVADRFYLPHNVDFRGRAYPIPPHLNHVGDDLSRGLLKFADSKPLGARGLRWLKIHLANVYGFDKASFDERENWTMDRMEEVYDSVTKPLDGRRWWLGADDPWQCLATCMELRNALESPDPLAFESNLPVHQDGTCNGLQHYAALGGDQIGAQQVNLAVTDRPSDVYTYVANMVEKQIDVDIAKGDEIAAILKGKISRKVVKQTVMTTVYGVTYVGARAQIERQLRDRKDIDRELVWAASAYIARNTLGSIDNLFSGAKKIQNWLHNTARLIAKSVPPARLEEAATLYTDNKGRSQLRSLKEQMTSVIWTTPMGLPIVQPYRKLKRKQIMAGLQSVYISDPNAPSEVNPVKQSSAFPPNFIHSLDATHMMLTALECRKKHLTFASVHDSYWTHASTVDTMSEIIRDTFIHLHSSDVMIKLRDEFNTRYKGYAIPLLSLNRSEIARINDETDITIQTSIKLTKKEAEQLVTSSRDDQGCDPAIKDRKLAKGSEAAEDVEDAEEVSEGPEDSTPVMEYKDPVLVLPKGYSQDLAVDGSKALSLKKHRGRASAILGVPEHDSALPAYKQFVPLLSVLPPLPPKGDFSVETIKRSLYFFS